ncbi:hypothetical protein V22_41790 [Calycomorphotria hydatis]|uniref:Uncharacterized protein n=2 Tax=Calycomorphotria hydatis TaxID=2528027 RepID=A0A517TEV8_9PLAN|nr:hypothetical protein V22_41790 [Calycomorphotria hydatis]
MVLLVAGMPMPTLTNIARLRIEAISFFLLLVFLSAWGVQLIWNSFAKDVEWLPRINYWRAVGVVFTWGMAFLLILTMISGARELLTPGAWEPNGWTYQLAETRDAETEEFQELLDTQREERRDRLRLLHKLLIKYAETNSGLFPNEERAKQLGGDLWRLPERGDAEFLYRDRANSSKPNDPLIVEPEVYDDPLMILVNGEIVPADYLRE